MADFDILKVLNYKERESLYYMGQDFSTEISSSLIPAYGMKVFKIFGQENFSFEKAQYQNKVDWSGFYTQYTSEHSVRYLTKKWDDGADLACLIEFSIIDQHLRVLKLEHQLLGCHKISGEIKALMIKKHLREKYEEFVDLKDQKLLQYLGSKRLLVICVDAEDEELIIPHNLLNENNLKFKHLIHFRKSHDGMLRTIAFRLSEDQQWSNMPKDYHFEPYLLITKGLILQK